MPRSKGRKAKPSVKNKSQLNTKWLNNVMRSIGSATADTFKSITPNISEVGGSVAGSIKEMQKSASKMSAQKVGKLLSQNKYVNLARNTLDRSIKDIKAGNLYNGSRSSINEEESGDSDWEDAFGDFEDDFGDDASVTFNYIDEGDNSSSNASIMISDAITSSSEAQVKATKASIDALIGVSSATISQIQQGFVDTNERLDAIASTLDAILQYHEENTTNYYEHALAAFERIGSAVDDTYKSTDNPLDIFKSSNGGLNMGAYKNYVKKRISRAVDDSPVGMLLPWLKDDDTLNMLLADPVGGLTKGVIGGMIPKVVEGTLREVDHTFEELIPNMVVSISKWAGDDKQPWLKQMIGKIFGVDLKPTGHMTAKEVTKDAATFDNVTRNAIVEVLPKYARESTEYLRQIAMEVTGNKDSGKLLADAEIFDPLTNSYKKKSDLMDTFTKGFTEAITSAFDSSEFGKVLNGVSGKLNQKDKKDYDNTLQQFIVELANSDTMSVKDYNLNDDKAKIHNVLKRINKGRSKNLIEESIRQMYDQQVGLSSAAMAQLNMIRAWKDREQDVDENYDRYNTHAIGVTEDTNYLKLMEEQLGNKTALELDEKAKKKKEKEEKEAKKKEDKEKNKNNRFKSNSDIVAGSIEDYKSGVAYSRQRDIKGGAIGDKLFSDKLTSGFEQMGGHAKQGMWNLMKGNSSGAWEEFSAIFSDQIKTMWDGVKENFFKPLGEKLFGKDAETGRATGLFENTRNSLNDTYKELMLRINGKAYTDSKGETHELGDGEESLVDKAFTTVKEVKEGLLTRLFGEKDKDGKRGKGEKAKGMVSNFMESIQLGLQGWKETIFGKEEDPDKQTKIDKQQIKDAVMKNLPDAIAGGGAGALFGAMSGASLLGTLIGGPIGGAVLGFTGSFLMKSDKFKDYLFGPEITDPNGEKKRLGGLISAKTQQFFKDNKSTIIGAGVFGALKSMVFPSTAGLLSSIVGGPVAGAAIGVGWSLLKKSDAWQTFLYGDEKTGRQGVVNAFKNIFKGGKGLAPGEKGGKDEGDKKSTLKALGMGVIGAAGGGLSAALIGKVGLLGAMATPAGPLGGAILGAAVGIAAGGKKFATYLFGEKDEEGNRKGGLVQKFGNYMHVEILAPLKSKVMDFVDDIKVTVVDDIMENIRLPFIAIADHVKKKLNSVKEFVGDKLEAFGNFMKEKVLNHVGSIMDKFIVQPAKAVMSKIADFTYKAVKLVTVLPFKILGGITRFLKSKITKFFGGLIKGALIIPKTIIKLAGRGVSAVVKTFHKGISGFFGMAKNFFGGIKDKFTNSKVGGGIVSGISKARSKINKFIGDDWMADYYASKGKTAEDKANLKKTKLSRRNMDYNRRQMAKVLGYDVKYFTEENWEKAKEAAKEQKVKIRWKGDMKSPESFEKDPAEARKEFLAENRSADVVKNAENSEDIEVRQYAEQVKTNEFLERIANNQEISEDRKRELDAEIEKQKKEEAEKAGFDYDEKTGKLTPKGDEDSRDMWRRALDENEEESEEEKAESEEEGPKKPSLRQRLKDKFNHGVDTIEAAGGLKKFLGRELSETFSIRKGYEGSDLQNWVNSRRGPAPEGEGEEDETQKRGRSKVASFFGRFGRRRAKGGEAKEGEALLVGDSEKDLKAAEIFVPKSDGKVLSQQGDGINVNITSFSDKAADDLAKTNAEAIKDELKGGSKNDGASPISLGLNGDSEQATGDYKALKEQQEKEEEKKKQDNYRENVINNLSGIKEGNKGHFNIWNKIFSKKGLITGALLFIGLKLIKNWKSISKIFSGVGDFVSKWINGNWGTNMMSTFELIKDNIEDGVQVIKDLASGKLFSAIGDFVLDEGQYDANSGGRASLVANLGRKTVKKGAKIVKGVKNLVSGAKSKVNNVKTLIQRLSGKGVQEATEDVADAALREGTEEVAERAATMTATTAAEKAGKEATEKVAQDSLQQWAAMLAENEADDVVKAGAEKVAGKAAQEATEATVEKAAQKTVTNVAKESVEATVEKTATSSSSKIITLVKEAFEKIASKLAEKFPKLGESKIFSSLKKPLAKMATVVEEKFAKISAKISAITSSKTASHAATLGLDTVVFCTVGAINGVSGTAKLFQVDQDKVDGTMTLISAAFGAIIVGTIVGSIIDVISGLIAEVLGFDFLNTIACCLYGILAGSDKADELNAAKEEFQEKYQEYQTQSVEEQYETQKAAGIIDSNVTLEQFQQGVEDGTYSVSTQSFQDYNADQHQSIGYKVGQGLSKGWKATKSFFTGTKSYTDDNGNTYVDNGDGTYKVTSKDGTELGNVSTDAVDTSTMEEQVSGGLKQTLAPIGKVFSKVGTTVKNFVGGAIDVGKALTSGVASIVKNFNNSDMSLSDYFNANINTLSEDNSMYGLVDGVLNISRFVMFPKLMMANICKKLFKNLASGISDFVAGAKEKLSEAVEGFGNFIDNAKTIAGDYGKNYLELNKIDKAGDVEGLKAWNPEISEDNPWAPFFKWWFDKVRMIHTPTTYIHSFAANIKEWIAEKQDEFKQSELGDFVDRLLTYTDPDKAWSGYKKETMGDGTSIHSMILSPMLRGVIGIFVGVKRGINWIGNKISDLFDGAVDTVFGWIDKVRNWAIGGDGEGTGGSGRGVKKLGGRGVDPDNENGFAYYSQDDARWANSNYVSSNANDGATMSDSGCGPTAMAMVASQAAQGKSISPTDMANLASKSGYRDETGTNEAFIGYASDNLGLSHNDTIAPSSDYISSTVSSGTPMILNGVSDDSSAFTPEGHYVVAVGTDANGNILVNDPRGKSYSRAFTPEELANSTRKAWSFGGSTGGRGTRRSKRGKIGGRGVSGDWMSIVKDVKALIAAQHPEYSQSNYITVTYNGKDWKVRTDCSGYVGLCLQIYGAIPEGTNVTSTSLLSNTAISDGFAQSDFTSWDNCQQGDIVTHSGHVEIFDHNEDGKHYVYSNGSTSSIASATPTTSGYPTGHRVVWRPNEAGTGANTSATVDSSSTTSSSTGSSTTSSASSALDVVSKVGSVFTKFASKALNGILTGNWDYDFSDDEDTAGTTSETSDSAAVDSNGSLVSANVSATDTTSKLWKFLRNNGLTAAGAAGLMGNLQAESGIRTNNLQDSYEKSLGMTDTAYTNAVNNGSYSNFVNDSAGYGLAQWTSSGRKQALLSLAQQQGKGIDDEDVQISHLWNELSGSYTGVLDTLKSTDNVLEASNKVLTDFESPKNQGTDVQQLRGSYAQGWYDKYANENFTDDATVANSKISSTPNQLTNVLNRNQSATMGGVGGRGSKHKTSRAFGGRGLFDNIQISDDQGDLYSLSSESSSSTNGPKLTVNTDSLEQLLTTAIKVLQSIDTNTAKIDGLSTGQASSTNYGGNVVVNNNNTSNTAVSDAVEATKATNTTSTNASLAMQIARGGM